MSVCLVEIGTPNNKRLIISSSELVERALELRNMSFILLSSSAPSASVDFNDLLEISESTRRRIIPSHSIAQALRKSAFRTRPTMPRRKDK